jgi:hypothetical protein
MEPNFDQERQQAHELLDMLPAAKVNAARSVLETMLDPASRVLAHAPVEDEAIGAEEERAAAEARDWLRHHGPIPHEEVLGEFGLTQEDFERMGRTPLPPEPNGADR